MRNVLLRSLVGASVLTIALMAPNVTRLLKALDRPAKNRAQLYRRISQGVTRLERQGLVTLDGPYGTRRVRLTAKGKKTLEQVELQAYTLAEPVFWDGKWRVLVFDIQEGRRKVRDQLRRLLLGAGFVRMQDSVWVYPHACDEFISLLRAHLRSGVGEMRYFVAEAVEADGKLREHFRLRSLTGLP